MNKGKVVRLAGFVGALGLSTVLVTTAIQGTGAYLTDSVDGNATANSATLKVRVDSGLDSNNVLAFDNLEPGKPETKVITVRSSSTSTINQDIWLVFDSSSYAYGQFTGSNKTEYDTVGDGLDGWTSGGLGRWGYFEVQAPNGNFRSINLQLPADHANGVPGWSTTSVTNDTLTCDVDQYGHGGSVGNIAAKTDVPAECGVPSAIKLAGNVAPNTSYNARIIFGLTGRATEQDTPVWTGQLPFSIVGTQVGILPGAEDF